MWVGVYHLKLAGDFEWLAELGATSNDDDCFPGIEYLDVDGFSDEAVQNFGDENLGTCYPTEEDAMHDLGPIMFKEEHIPEQGNVEIYEDLQELEDFEVEASIISEVDEELHHMIIFNKHKHLENPVLIPGMIFGTNDEFKRMIQSLSIQTQKPIKFTKNEKWRVRAECRVKGCPFVVLCSRYKSTNDLSIKTIKDVHTCGNATRNKMVSVKFLAHKYINKIRREPRIQLHVFMGQVGFKAGCRKFVCLDGCFLKGGFKGQLLAVVGCDADNGIYPVAWAIVEVENTPTKGLENAIAAELPYAEHRLCMKYLHANWSKRYSRKTFKDLMWEAARACNVDYFESIMEKIKAISVDAYEALNKIQRSKWTRCAFKPTSNCPMLVNNWAEAFNKVILKAREQPIITLLNNIHNTIMNRLQQEHVSKSKWQGKVCPRVDELLKLREKHTKAYITRPSGIPRYSVSTGAHSFVVDIAANVCSCGLWQLSGVPCIHGVCVYQSHNKDPRQYVHKDFSTKTFLEVYNHFLEPIRGASNWPKTNYPDILPPNIRVPKRKRHIDVYELQNKVEKVAEERVKKAKNTGNVVYKTTRKGGEVHCKHCGRAKHNARTCPLKKLNNRASSS
ncbi:hypothetical protein LIER_23176 [Lithospermum erythrorhizon]|uniref:SWIM-type domain-containing protein n=1 Tax=Lithospermum erythrorhizon TaxID=34254 RepID=A0AAV3QWQ1_LITER